MGRTANLYCLCAIFSIWAVPVALKHVKSGNGETIGSQVNRTGPSSFNGSKGVAGNVTKCIEGGHVFPKSCGQQKPIGPKGRIVGGKTAFLGEYPWIARLMHKDKQGRKSFGCSGFLVHSRFVITAGHCTHPHHTQRRGPVFSVILGEHNTETEEDCTRGGTFCAEPLQTRKIAKVITHPDYDPENIAHYNDIAIIYMKKRAIFSDFVQPICLQKADNPHPTRYFLSGWGKTESESSSKIKMKVDIPPFDAEKCAEQYSPLSINLKNTQICAGGEKKKDACTGDSGGPLMSSVNGTWYASGIVSYGIGCGMEGWPGVYTNIEKFLPWIKCEITLNSMLTVRSNKRKGKKRKAKKAKTQNENN